MVLVLWGKIQPAYPPDKQMQHTQADTIEKAGPGSYYGTEQHGAEWQPLWRLVAQLGQCLSQNVASTSPIYCSFINVEVELRNIKLNVD